MPSLFHRLLCRSFYQHPLVEAYCAINNTSHDNIGWGYKYSGKVAIQKDSFTLFEDGFIRSMFPGYKLGSLYSLVVDRSGIYYDAEGKSDLIKFLNGEQLDGSQWQKKIAASETKRLLARVRNSGVSKYNCHLYLKREIEYELGVLVVDQTRGDAAIRYAGLVTEDFERMLKDALAESENDVYVKTHPDHQYRKKHTCFPESLLRDKRVKVLPSDMPISEALAFCHTVYVGSSLLGMEALIHDKKVVTYGWSFYAGWGLTEDRAKASKPLRKNKVSIERLFEAAYLRYTHYFDPDTSAPCGIERIIEHIETQWKSWRLGMGEWRTCGLTPWKKQLLPLYLGPKSKVVSSKSEGVKNAKRIITWGAKDVPNEYDGSSLTRIEDGFIRSRGLGANFNFPLSWVFDDVGIYFDARSSSRLEQILENHEFSEDECNQAQELIDFLAKSKLTKYNLGLEEAVLPKEAIGKKLILVPGQVDSDASIKFGSPKIKNNRELLEEVRRQNPDAFICYKPHPDLVAGARKDAPLWDGIENDVDHLVEEGDIISWVQAVDEVHTLTSTVGFEALIHKKPVYTYGMPFYAGWGLTKDWIKCERRTSRRTLVELACAAYILYPSYLNPKNKEFTTALNAAKLLVDKDFNYDSRTGFLKLLGKMKAWFYRCSR